MWNSHYNKTREIGDWREPIDETPSQTVPDMSYTIKELLERHTNGSMPPVYREAIYQELDNWEVNPMVKPDFELSDLQELKDHVDRRVSDLTKKRNTEEVERKRKAEETFKKFVDWQKAKKLEQDKALE